jgi:hypothetical protein
VAAETNGNKVSSTEKSQFPRRAVLMTASEVLRSSVKHSIGFEDFRG